MKPVFFDFTPPWGAGTFSLLLLVVGLMGAPLAAPAQSATWNSSDYGSSFTFPPTVNATNFYNTATWNILTGSPYETSHTLNFTNKSTMTGSVGWEFDFGPTGNGGRSWAANFFNDNGATVSALDAYVAYFVYNPTIQSHLIVSATNIVNKGLLSAGANGEIVLSGANVDIHHSTGVEITSVSVGDPLCGFILPPPYPTNYYAEPGIYDSAWEVGVGGFTIGGPWWSPPAMGGYYFYGVSEPCSIITNINHNSFIPNAVNSYVAYTIPQTLMLTNGDVGPAPGAVASLTVYSNIYHQGVFVYTGNNNITAQIQFADPLNPTNGFKVALVRLAMVSTNVVTLQTEANYLYLADAFAAVTNRDLVYPLPTDPYNVCNDTTYRPSAYGVSRCPFTGLSTFYSGFGTPPGNFYYDPGFATNVLGIFPGVALHVTGYSLTNVVYGGDGALYNFLVDNVAAQPTSVTNLPGRVRIYANNLNLNQAHIRAEGQIVIQATNLVSSAGAIMDCQNLSFKLGSTNGQLDFVNLAGSQVSRLNGTCQMITAVWSNYLVTIYPNYYPSNNGVGMGITYMPEPITNYSVISCSVTIVDASGLVTTRPVTVQDLVLRSTNIVVSDSVSPVQSFLLDGQSVTLLGDLTLSGVLQNWSYANAPSLRYFTNNGYLSIPGYAHFGDDGPTNLLAFVNNGLVYAGAQTVNSVNLQLNGGGNYCNIAGFIGIAQTAQLTGSIIQSLSDIQFYANSLTLTNQSILATFGALDLTVTNNLTDGGMGSDNLISCENGFNLYRKPTTGDLLGTAVNSYAPLNAVVDHYWAGNNSGASLAGFHDNVALGSLALIPTSAQIPGHMPEFDFYGTTGNNGLYVSNLDLSMLVDFTNEVYIDPSITIYYVSAFLNPDVHTGVQTPEQYLNGRFGNHLQWVGVSSLAKTKPLSYGKMVGTYKGVNGQFQLMVNTGAGQSNFVIQASTDLKNWVPLYTNNGPFGIYNDPNAGSFHYRFYRTVPGP